MLVVSPRRRIKKKSQYDNLFKVLISLGFCSIVLAVFGVLEYRSSGMPGLGTYILTVAVAWTAGFLCTVFVPVGSKWLQLVFWAWFATIIIAISLHLHSGGWTIAYGMGIVLGASVVRRRHDRKVKKQFGDRLLIVGDQSQCSARLPEQLTTTGLLMRRWALDGDKHPMLTATWGKRQLSVLGDAQGGLVVLFTADIHDDNEWRRLTAPGASADKSSDDDEVEVPIGKITGRYPTRSIVDIDTAGEVCLHFARTGDMDPSHEWEPGQDVLDRLPPNLVRM